MLLTGKGASGGISEGRLVVLEKTARVIEKKEAENQEAELARYMAARGEAMAQLDALAAGTAEKLGEESAMLFEIHRMMLEDMDYHSTVCDLIQKERFCAEYALQQTAEQFAAMLRETGDDYMRERAADVHDVSARVLNCLLGRAEPAQRQFSQPVILAADDFSPSETAQLDRGHVVGLATRQGAANSHTAIFARAMGIPAVIALGEQLRPEMDGKMAVLEGDTGRLYLEPEKTILSDLRRRKAEQDRAKSELERWRGRTTATKSRRAIKLFANIGSVADAKAALAGDAEGIGLFRSEFLFLERDTAPDEDTQLEAYRAVAEMMQGREVIIRTLDIGADKQVPYLGLPGEQNPAMGLRAIRLCLTRPDLFKTQLRAIYRASIYGNVSIMLPMIVSLDEVHRAKEMALAVCAGLESEGIPFRPDVPIGIMIETPASALISDKLAKEVDFFSIGTNDLTQYTLAVDRENQAAAEFCDVHHEAVLRLIELTAKHAHDAGIWVGICGELAADESLTGRFLQAGIDELSVAPSAVLRMRAAIAALD